MWLESMYQSSYSKCAGPHTFTLPMSCVMIVQIVAAVVPMALPAGGAGLRCTEHEGGYQALEGHHEELLTGPMVQQSLDKARAHQPLSLGDLGRLLRHACGSDLYGHF
eukprot:gene10249-9056_t